MVIYKDYIDNISKSLTIREREQIEVERTKFESIKKERARVVISKIGITFWGSLIIEDIIL